MNLIVRRSNLAFVLSGLTLAAILLLAGCQAQAPGPEVFYSYATAANSQSRPRVYVAVISDTLNNRPVAMTVLDPVTGRELDTFPLTADGAHPCGIASSQSRGNPVTYGVLDDRYIPFGRWKEAAKGQGLPYRVRIYFRSDRGLIWETEVSARYSGCATK